ncbi:MAG: chalcone isomerase family protein [Gammaproteobacteria bacterium]|nr:chalcone isomerase family protein [Gammaproteobacteria bacterium]
MPESSPPRCGTFLPKARYAALCLCLSLAPGAPASPPLPEPAPVISSDLVLNGTGTRRLMFAKLYTCHLFLPRRTSSFDEIASLDGSVEIHLDVHGDTPDSLPDDWEKVLDEELSQQLYQKTKSHYQELTAGDRVVVAYDPDDGTEVWLNGEKQFTAPGTGLMRALLEQWVGEEPVSQSLRQSLLAQ